MDFLNNFQSVATQMLDGMWVSMHIFISTLLFGLILGLFVAFARMSSNKVVSFIAKVYISVMRGTPLMLQLLVVYFGPWFLFGIKIGASYKMVAVLLGFAINYAAYFAEIYRSGIGSMPTGQYEAAKVLGYSKVQTFRYIIFPQVMKRILPPITNETITLVKDTSLAFSLSVIEVFTTAKQLAAAETSMFPFVVAGIFYYVFNLLVAIISEQIEKKLSYYH